MPNKIRTVVYVLLALITPGLVNATDLCPARKGHSLRNLEVFDGLPEELASLEAEETGPKTSYLQLGYIFDAGRIVTMRCYYDDRFTVEMKLTKRIERCDFKFDGKQRLKVNCK